MLLSDVKPMHCKMVLNQMDNDYAGSTIQQTYICMGTMLKSALMNDLIETPDEWCTIHQACSCGERY